MRILVVAVGTRMPPWVVDGFEEYRARMPRECRLDLVEVRPEKRGASGVEQALEREGRRIQAALPARALRLVLDERGTSLDTRAFAGRLARWLASGREPAFIIGGADGIAAPLKASADETLALSAMTLPHGLARVLLAEQIYRAHTLLSGHPYHRE